MKWLLLMILLVAVASGDDTGACPWKAKNCTCSPGGKGDTELRCPEFTQLTMEPSVTGEFSPRRYAQFRCTNMSDWSQLSYLSGLQLGDIRNVSIKLCPLPGISFKEIMASMGIPSARLFQFQSYGNMSNRLTRSHLEGLEDLTTLHLNMNGLTLLPTDIFHDLPNLKVLDLKNNNLQLPKGIFRLTPLLEALELGGNNMSHLEAGVFQNMTHLRFLNLWGNRLANLTRSVFSDVPNLESLDLSNNRLLTIDSDLFADLIKLKKINLNSNSFTSLPDGLFSNNPRLETVQLMYSKSLGDLPQRLFSNLTNLRGLSLRSSGVSALSSELFLNSSSLEILNLQQNKLKELPQGIFNDLKELATLDLSRNSLSKVPDSIFASLLKLKTLDLSWNQLDHVPKDLFIYLNELETLNLSHNKIRSIHSQAFEHTAGLVSLDMSDNLLETMRKAFTFLSEDDVPSVLQSCVRLQYLYLSKNKLDSMYEDWMFSMVDLRKLDLSQNNFSQLSIRDFQFTSTKLSLDLSLNNITVISFDHPDEVAFVEISGSERLPSENPGVSVTLKGNPLTCDCEAYSLLRYLRGEILPMVKLVFRGGDFTCSGNSPESQVRGMLLERVDPRLLFCQVVDNDCPPSCSCFFRPADSGLIVDCSNSKLTAPPLDLPNVATHRTNHTVLDLRYNQLTALPDSLAPGYSTVTHLYLSHNNISYINLSSFSKQLQIIELNDNNFTRLGVNNLKQLEGLKYLESLRLENNPWICDCEAKHFVTFLQANYKKVEYIGNVSCSTGARLAKMTGSELCPYTNVVLGFVGLTIALLGLVVGGLLALYYRHQTEVRVWLYSKGWCLWFVTEDEIDRDKLYDAFVSYSHQDEELVTKHLQPALEADDAGSHRFKLCLHYRDWIVGDFIPDQIARSVAESRRTIVILSPNFLESVWGRMEFRAAHSQALSEGRARVIVILYGDIGPTEELDPELRAYLSTNTYVKWGDPWFWEKLRYALPHPPGKGRSGGGKGTLVPPAHAYIQPLKTLSNSKPV